jgi:hypothetical protein
MGDREPSQASGFELEINATIVTAISYLSFRVDAPKLGPHAQKAGCGTVQKIISAASQRAKGGSVKLRNPRDVSRGLEIPHQN